MRLWIVPAVALGLMAAACNSSEQAPAAATTPVAEAKLAGVDLTQPVSVLGNEPFWGLAIADGKVAYSDPEVPTGGPNGTIGAPEMLGNVAIWRSTLSDQSPLVITLTGTDCSDGMSDRTYPLAAKVELGERVLNGCAASTAAIAAAGESGRVE